MVDHISHGREAVYAAQFAVDTFAAEPVAHRGTRFNSVELDSHRNKFVSHTGQRVRTLHVHARCGGKVEHDKFRQCRLGADTGQNLVRKHSGRIPERAAKALMSPLE
jgi:hypothetical protein